MLVKLTATQVPACITCDAPILGDYYDDMRCPRTSCATKDKVVYNFETGHVVVDAHVHIREVRDEDYAFE